MVRHRLDWQDIEKVRGATLRYMTARGLTSEDVARMLPTVRADTLRRFLAGRRPSQRVAVCLVERLPLGLRYSPPQLTVTETTYS